MKKPQQLSNTLSLHEHNTRGVDMADNDVIILRLGYRLGRDPRITTHLALVARALGANKFLFSGDEDKRLSENINSVNERFGGEMVVGHLKSPMAWLKKFVREGVDGSLPGTAVHLTMYGAPYQNVTPTIRRDRPLVVIVGGAKVPSEVFQISQYNLAVGNQPHSEVAALALFLDGWYGTGSISRKMDGGELIINPSNHGKDVTDNK
tara:strand:- start:2861 stop:3481 length:621 start_codon:yes stop_codon:yes gene_type:complete